MPDEPPPAELIIEQEFGSIRTDYPIDDQQRRLAWRAESERDEWTRREPAARSRLR